MHAVRQVTHHSDPNADDGRSAGLRTQSFAALSGPAVLFQHRTWLCREATRGCLRPKQATLI
jgi:hypothetical protein